MSSSPPPCAISSFICSWNSVRPVSRVRLKLIEYGPPQPTMLPAARMRAPMALARGDAVAHRRQRPQHAVAVAHGGDAVAQLNLRRLEHDVLLTIVVAHERLVPIVHAAVQREVDVGVGETRHDEFAVAVHDLRARRHWCRRTRPDRADPVAGDDDDAVTKGSAAVSVDHRRADDGDRARLRADDRDARGQGEDQTRWLPAWSEF